MEQFQQAGIIQFCSMAILLVEFIRYTKKCRYTVFLVCSLSIWSGIDCAWSQGHRLSLDLPAHAAISLVTKNYHSYDDVFSAIDKKGKTESSLVKLKPSTTSEDLGYTNFQNFHIEFVSNSRNKSSNDSVEYSKKDKLHHQNTNSLLITGDHTETNSISNPGDLTDAQPISNSGDKAEANTNSSTEDFTEIVTDDQKGIDLISITKDETKTNTNSNTGDQTKTLSDIKVDRFDTESVSNSNNKPSNNAVEDPKKKILDDRDTISLSTTGEHTEAHPSSNSGDKAETKTTSITEDETKTNTNSNTGDQTEIETGREKN